MRPTRPAVSMLAAVMGGLAALLLMIIMVIMVSDVAARYVFNAPIRGAYELTEFLMCLMIMTALPLVGLRGEHVEASLIADLLPRLATFMRWLAGLTSLAVFVALAHLLWVYGGQLARQNSQSLFGGIPHAPFAYFASILFALAALAAVYAMLAGTLNGNDDRQDTGS